ncbi:MAG: hypothetical protein GX224_01720 [Thermoplasmatales archaeon]|nr:hypothetical protein [Thermoplasmatales archaeon]
MEIPIDDDVREMIIKSGEDYRVSTACRGPTLVPVSVKPPKSSDIRIPVGDRFLYVSLVQARYISRVTMDMLYDPEDLYTCSVLRAYR